MKNLLLFLSLFITVIASGQAISTLPPRSTRCDSCLVATVVRSGGGYIANRMYFIDVMKSAPGGGSVSGRLNTDSLIESATNKVMTAAERSKLASIAVGATNITNNNQLINGAGYLLPSDTVKVRKLTDSIVYSDMFYGGTVANPLKIYKSDPATDGYLSASDFNRFQNKISNTDTTSVRALTDTSAKFISNNARIGLTNLKMGAIMFDTTLHSFAAWDGIQWRLLNTIQDTASTIPQNLLTYSENFATNWTTPVSPGSISIDTINAPDGTKTADIITAHSGSYGGLFRRNFTYSGLTYTASIYLKKANWDYVGLRIAGASSGDSYGFINLTNRAVNNIGIIGLMMRADSLANGWIRLSITYKTTAGDSIIDLSLVDSNGYTGFGATGTESVYVWGAQLNQGPLKIYTQTTGTIVP